MIILFQLLFSFPFPSSPSLIKISNLKQGENFQGYCKINNIQNTKQMKYYLHMITTVATHVYATDYL